MPILTIIGGYLLGSIPFAWLVARLSGTADLRQAGSGNVGAANVLRVSGVASGLLVALLDVAKGAVSVLLAERLVGGNVVPLAAGLASILGHVFPVWLRFGGGKGVATACGVFAVLTPTAVPLVMVVFVGTVWLTKHVSAGSLLASVALPPAAYALGYPASAVGGSVVAAVLIVFRHRSNIERLRRGTERRFGARE
jgi:glycerol-3-phosphate acyltransferase PlsY